MTDIDLDLILPPELVLRRGDGEVIATIPGELPMVDMLQIVQLQADGKRYERFLLDTPNTSENADAREEAEAGVRAFYEQCAAFLQRHATMAVEGEVLELTATQIITLITLLGSPQDRAQLIGEALMRALELSLEAEDEVPLESESLATSSPSAGSEDGKAPTGARSPGASSSRSGEKRSKPKP